MIDIQIFVAGICISEWLQDITIIRGSPNMSYKSQLPFSETLFTEVVDFIYECLYIENNCKNMNYAALDTDDSFIQSESIDMTRTFTSSCDNSVYSDETVESNLLSTAQSKKTFVHVYNDYEYINKPREKYFIARSNLKNVKIACQAHLNPYQSQPVRNFERHNQVT